MLDMQEENWRELKANDAARNEL